MQEAEGAELQPPRVDNLDAGRGRDLPDELLHQCGRFPGGDAHGFVERLWRTVKYAELRLQEELAQIAPSAPVSSGAEPGTAADAR